MKVFEYAGQDCALLILAESASAAYPLLRDKLNEEGLDDNVGVDELMEIVNDDTPEGVIEFIDYRSKQRTPS